MIGTVVLVIVVAAVAVVVVPLVRKHNAQKAAALDAATAKVVTAVEDAAKKV